MEENLFYVGIQDPVELRKELLLSSKNLIDSLKRYESYQSVRSEKLQFVLELKHVFDELLVLNKKLRAKLPKVPVKQPALKRELPKPKKTEMKGASRSKLQLLEDELAQVEKRLGSLE